MLHNETSNCRDHTNKRAARKRKKRGKKHKNEKKKKTHSQKQTQTQHNTQHKHNTTSVPLVQTIVQVCSFIHHSESSTSNLSVQTILMRRCANSEFDRHLFLLQSKPLFPCFLKHKTFKNYIFFISNRMPRII